MNEKSYNPSRLAYLIAALIGGGGLTYASFYASLPDRVATMEKRQIAMEADRKDDRELLVRIEERLIAVQSQLNHQPKAP